MSEAPVSAVPAVAAQPPAGQPAAGTAGEPGVTRRYAWAVFALAFALMMFNYADRQLLVSMFPHFKKEWGLSDAQLGGLVSILSVTVAAATFPVALLVDRRSRVQSIALMGGVWSLATVSAAVTRNYGQLLGTRAAVGLGEAGYAPAAGALLSRMFPQRLRATIFGAFLSAASLGSVLGVIIGGVVAARWGWRAAFVVVGAPGLLLALLFLLVRDYPTVALPAGPADAPKAGARGLLAELLRPRSAVASYFGGATQIVVMSALYAWLPSYFNRYLGLPAAQAAARTALVMLAGFIGQIVLSYAADRLARRDRRRRLQLPAALSVMSMVLLVAAFAAMRPGNPQLLVILIAGFTITAPFGVVGSVSVDVVDPALRATAVSMVALAQNLFGFAVGPLVVGVVSDAYGLKAAMAVIPVFCAFAACFLWSASRHYDSDLRRVAAATGTPATFPAGKDAAR
ncbi:MAG: MFS transporter [Streptosporangiaceae bacterium]